MNRAPSCGTRLAGAQHKTYQQYAFGTAGGTNEYIKVLYTLSTYTLSTVGPVYADEGCFRLTRCVETFPVELDVDEE